MEDEAGLVLRYIFESVPAVAAAEEERRQTGVELVPQHIQTGKGTSSAGCDIRETYKRYRRHVGILNQLRHRAPDIDPLVLAPTPQTYCGRYLQYDE